jgi:hypothetical protein
LRQHQATNVVSILRGISASAGAALAARNMEYAPRMGGETEECWRADWAYRGVAAKPAGGQRQPGMGGIRHQTESNILKSVKALRRRMSKIRGGALEGCA